MNNNLKASYALNLFSTFLFLLIAISLNAQDLFINEYLASNDAGIVDEAGEFEDWVELYNSGNTPIDIGGMYLTDDLSNPTLWQIPLTDPASTTIAPGGFLYLFFDKDLDQGILHVDAKLGAGGEAIGLFAQDGITVIDSLTFGPQLTDVSEGRVPDGGTTWSFFSESTPGATNDSDPLPGQVEIPVADIEGGIYPAGDIVVTLSSATPDATIYYTLDAADPDNNSTEYNGPITLDDVSTIRAIAYSDPMEPSKTMTHTYLIDVNHTFAIIALNTDPDHLYDSEEGIFENYEEDIEQPAHIAFYEPDGTLAFAQDIGIEIQGNAAASLPQKSLKLKAKAGLGNEFFEYPIFPGLPFDQYRSFLIRNSGQDWNKTWIRDALGQNIFTDLNDLNGIIKDPDLDSQGYRPGVVYLNGEYYGIYNIREQMNWKYLNMHYGIEDGEVDIIERTNTADDGDNIEWNAFIDFLEENEFSSEENYNLLSTKVDPEHYIDYQLQGILLDNNDWPGQNNKHWRERTPDGTWRWMTKDLDFGLGLRPLNGPWGSGDFTTDMVSVCLAENSSEYYNAPRVTLLLRRLMENDQSKNYFINRGADYLNVLFNTERLLTKIDSFENLYIPEMDQHMDVWQSGWNGTASKIEKLRIFANGRENAVRGHIVDYFPEVDGLTDVTLNANPIEGGQINFSTLTLGESVFPWDGIYFRGIDIPVQAIPNRGYFFEDWSEANLGDNPVGVVNISGGNYALTANFSQGSTETGAIVINEINYNSPADVDPGDWVELYNANDAPVDISGWYFEDESGNFFGLPANTIMPGNSYIILAENEEMFSAIYPNVSNIYGNFAQDPGGFKLSGKGERITLKNAAGVLIDEVDFDDKDPWPTAADGDGPTLQLITPSLDNALAQSWLAFEATPGLINAGALITDCPVDIEILIPIGTGGATATWTEPTVNNDCPLGGATITQTSGLSNGSFFPSGISTILYQATDNCEAIGECSFTISIIETNGNLSLDCSDNIIINAGVGGTSAIVNWTEPSFNSTCPNGGASITQSGPANGSSFPLGTTTISYTATDDCGNTQSCSFDITVENSPSSIDLVCPEDIIINIPEGSGGALVEWEDAQATTNCPGGSLSINQVGGATSGSTYLVGAHQITYQATNDCGDIETCSFTIEVTESSGTLELECPSDIVVDIPSGATTVDVNWLQPIAISTCNGGMVNPNCDEENLAGFEYIGAIADHKYFLSDEKDTWLNAQNICESFGGHLVVINDAAENLFLQNNTIYSMHMGLNDINQEGTYEWVNGDPVTYTNFDFESNSESNDFGYFRGWNAAWTMKAGDVNKNYAMELDCSGGSSISITQTGGPSSGSGLSAGTYTVTYNATDDCGGNQSCSFNIIVNAPLPVIDLECPEDISFVVPIGSAGQTVSWQDAQATTDCPSGNISILQTEGMASGNLFAIGTHVITYEASDDCGLFESCSFTINILEDLPSSEYCESEASAPWFEYITNVTFGTINNTSGKDGYGDYTDQSTNLVSGSNYPISILPKFSYTQYDEYFQVWIDYNRDFDFNDPGELVFSTIRNAGPGGTDAAPLTGTVTIPDGITNGSTRMRISMARNAFAGSCDLFINGEVEDYSVSLTGGSIEGFSSNNSGAPINVNAHQDFADTEDIFIFPNPAKDQITIRSDRFDESILNIKLVNILGQVTKTWTAVSTNGKELKLGLGNLPFGTYTLMVEQNGETFGKLLMIK